MADKRKTPDESLQQEFNRWAEAGEGEKMREPSSRYHRENPSAVWTFDPESACWI